MRKFRIVGFSPFVGFGSLRDGPASGFVSDGPRSFPVRPICPDNVAEAVKMAGREGRGIEGHRRHNLLFYMVLWR
jgi:hypothetical protein